MREKKVPLTLVLSILLSLCVCDAPVTPPSAVSDTQSPNDRVTVDFDDTSWIQVLNWDFSDGWYDGGWSWGEWRMEDGLLTGFDPDGNYAVYIIPFTHGDRVILETKVRLVKNTDDHPVEAHLLTRDGSGVQSESGMVIVADGNLVYIRHMIGTEQYFHKILQAEERFSKGQWYVLRFIMRDGMIDAFVDGEHVFSSTTEVTSGGDVSDSTGLLYPAVVYHEPHLAVRYGEAQFEYLRIYADESTQTPMVVDSSNGRRPQVAIERHWLVTVIIWIFCAIIFIVCVYLVRHYVFTLNRLFGRQRQPYMDIDTAEWPEVTVVIPAHNEELVIGEILEALLEVDYPHTRLTILPVNDRSKDRTGEIIDDFARQYPDRLIPYHRRKGRAGKAAVLNDALGKIGTEIVLIFDADYVPGKGLIKQLVAPFFDPEVGAVMGRVVPYNVGTNLLTRLLDLERAGGYQVDQQARMNLNMVPQYGGTVGGVRKSALQSVGGWREDSLAEDTDATYRLLLGGWKTVYQNRSECYEQVTETWASRIRQIMRWAKGHNQASAQYGLSLLRNHRTRWLEKLDGFLLLGVYVMSPVLVFCWLLGMILWYLGEPHAGLLYILLVTCYSTIGNFAVFYEITAAAQLDGARERICLLPFVFLGFLVSLFTVSRVTFAHVGINGNGKNGDVVWDKTERISSFNGYANGYANGRNGHANGRNGHANGRANGRANRADFPLEKQGTNLIPSSRFFAKLADAHRKQGNPARAVEILESGLTANPSNVAAHMVLAASFTDKGEHAGALRAYERVLEIDPYHAVAMKKMSKLLFDMGVPEKARIWALNYLEEVGEDDDVEKLLTRIDNDSAHRKQSLETEDPEAEAIEDSPPENENEIIATMTLADIYSSQGFYEKAIRIYEIILEREPSNETARKRIQQIRAGQVEKPVSDSATASYEEFKNWLETVLGKKKAG